MSVAHLILLHHTHPPKEFHCVSPGKCATRFSYPQALFQPHTPPSPPQREHTPAIPMPAPHVSQKLATKYGPLPHIPYNMRVRFEVSEYVDSSTVGERHSTAPEMLDNREQFSRLTTSPSLQPAEVSKMDCMDASSSDADRLPGSRDTRSIYVFHSDTTPQDDDAQSDMEVDEPLRSVCLRPASWCQPHGQYADVVGSQDNNRTLTFHHDGGYQESLYPAQSQLLDPPTTLTPGPSTSFRKHVGAEYRPSSSPRSQSPQASDEPTSPTEYAMPSPTRSQSPQAPNEPTTSTGDAMPSHPKRPRRQAALQAEQRMLRRGPRSSRYPSVHNNNSVQPSLPHALEEPPTPTGQGPSSSRPRRRPRQAALRAQHVIQKQGVVSAPSVGRVATTRRLRLVDPTEKNYCTVCEKHCTRISDLRRHEFSEGHLRRVGKRGPGDSISILTSFICGKCGNSFSRKDALQRHQRDYAQCHSLRRHRKSKDTSRGRP